MLRICLMLLSVICLVGWGLADEVSPNPKTDEKPPVNWRIECVLFKVGGDELIAKAVVESDRFEEWFVRDYGVAGERVETPAKARVFGVLTAHTEAEVHVLPFYRFRDLYVCQSYRFGDPPKFSVWADSEAGFIEMLRQKLRHIKDRPS